MVDANGMAGGRERGPGSKLNLRIDSHSRWLNCRRLPSHNVWNPLEAQRRPAFLNPGISGLSCNVCWTWPFIGSMSQSAPWKPVMMTSCEHEHNEKSLPECSAIAWGIRHESWTESHAECRCMRKVSIKYIPLDTADDVGEMHRWINVGQPARLSTYCGSG